MYVIMLGEMKSVPWECLMVVCLGSMSWACGMITLLAKDIWRVRSMVPVRCMTV